MYYAAVHCTQSTFITVTLPRPLSPGSQLIAIVDDVQDFPALQEQQKKGEGEGPGAQNFLDNIACLSCLWPPSALQKQQKKKKKKKCGGGRAIYIGPQDFLDNVACGPPSALQKKKKLHTEVTITHTVHAVSLHYKIYSFFSLLYFFFCSVCVLCMCTSNMQ